MIGRKQITHEGEFRIRSTLRRIPSTSKNLKPSNDRNTSFVSYPLWTLRSSNLDKNSKLETETGFFIISFGFLWVIILQTLIWPLEITALMQWYLRSMCFILSWTHGTMNRQWGITEKCKMYFHEALWSVDLYWEDWRHLDVSIISESLVLRFN